MAQAGWLSKTLGGRTVTHMECPHPAGKVSTQAPPKGVVHTIEGGLESGLGVFLQHYAPHFSCDSDTIYQHVPLGTMASALENHEGGVETNSVVLAQIEVAGYSSVNPWLPGAAEVLSDLMATLYVVQGIPLTRPYPDDMPPLPWSTYTFQRRNTSVWQRVGGWFGHVDTPENAHWDPGWLRWSWLLQRAETIAKAAQAPPLVPPRPHPDPPAHAAIPLPPWYWPWLNWWLGEGPYKRYGPHNQQHRPQHVPGHVPQWAWQHAAAFVAARKAPTPTS